MAIKKNPASNYKPVPPDLILPPGQRPFTRFQVDNQMRAVEQLLTSLASPSQIETICRQEHRIGKRRVQTLIKRVFARWNEEDAQNRPAWKSAAMRRLNRWIIAASGRQDTSGNWIAKPDFPTLARMETLLADIQGTREPVKISVDVRVSAACMSVIAGLSAEQVDKYLDEYKQNVRLAEAYKNQTAIAPPSKVVNGSTNGSTNGRH